MRCHYSIFLLLNFVFKVSPMSRSLSNEYHISISFIIQLIANEYPHLFLSFFGTNHCLLTTWGSFKITLGGGEWVGLYHLFLRHLVVCPQSLLQVAQFISPLISLVNSICDFGRCSFCTGLHSLNFIVVHLLTSGENPMLKSNE